MWLDRHDRVVIAVGEQDRALVAGDGRRRADVVDDVAARPEVDAGRQPGERVGDRGPGSAGGPAERLSSEAVRARRAGRGDDGGDPWVRGGRQDRADATHRMAEIAPTLTSGCSIRAWKAASESCAELAGGQWQRFGRVLAVAADVECQAVEPGCVEEHGEGQRAIAGRLPAVDEDDARAAPPPRAGMNHAGRATPLDSMTSTRTASQGRPA